MLEVESLTVEAGVVEHYYGGCEVHYLFAVDDGRLFEFVPVTSADSCGPSNHVLQGSFGVTASYPVHPLKLSLCVFRLFQVVLMEGLTIQPVGNDRLKSGVEPSPESDAPLVVDQL